MVISSNKLKYNRLFCVTIFIFTLTITTYTKEKLVFSTIHSIVIDASAEILKVAYERIGYEVEFKLMPGKRSLYESNKGRTDGETARIRGINKVYENLILVDVPINSFEIRVFSKKYDFYIDDINNFKDYTFAIRRGIVIYEKLLGDFNKVYSEDSDLNFKRLNSDVVDFILTTGITGLVRIKNKPYKGIKMLEPSLAEYHLYHYVHKKNEEIVPKITAVLQEMEKSGEIDRIKNTYYDSLLK